MAESTVLATLKSSSAFIAVELADVLSDKEAIHVLVNHFSEYASVFRNGASFVRSLPQDRELCVLLDCDVIYAYLHPEKMKPEQSLLARWFFEESNIKYAIPAGAYKELLSHLSSTFGLPPQPIPRREYENPRDAVMARLGISSEDANDPSVVSQVESMTDDRVMRLDRLLRIFEDHSRFCSIKRAYDRQICDVASDLVRAEREEVFERVTQLAAPPDSSRPPHDKNDFRDGENLAIALNAELAEEANLHFVLVTMTRPVLRAARTLFRSRASRGAWFALLPEQLIPPAKLGLSDPKRRHDVRVRLSNLKGEVETLIGSYNNFLDEIGTGVSPTNSRIQELVEETTTTLAELHSQGMGRIESVRRPINSARLAGSDYIQCHGAGRLKHFHPRFTSYLRLLERMRKNVHQLSGIDYSVQTRESPDPGRVKMFSIGNDPDNRGFEEFISVEVFEDGDGLQLWTAQWELDVNESHLFEAIEELSFDQHGITLRGKQRGDSTVEINPRAGSNIWDVGIVVSSGNTAFGINLQDALGNGSWNDLSLATLKEIVLRGTANNRVELKSFLDYPGTRSCSGGIGTLIQEKVRTIPVFSERDPIEEIRINLPEVDLVFEIVPPDGSYRQRFTMMSSKPLYAALAHLYDWLGIRLAAKSELEKQVRQVLGPYFG